MLSMIRRRRGRVDFVDIGKAEAEEVEKVKGETRGAGILGKFYRNTLQFLSDC